MLLTAVGGAAVAPRAAVWRGTLLGMDPRTASHGPALESNALRTAPGTATAAWPSPREGQAVAFDFQSQRVIMFGGATDTGWSNETWTYSVQDNAWTLEHPAAGPSAQVGASMTYDPVADRALLVGGADGIQTWAYDDETHTWTNLGPPSAPTVPGLVAYDSSAGVTVFYGYGETWSFTYAANTWENRTSLVRPPVDANAALVYDPVASRTLLFGGSLPGSPWVSNETWAYDSATNAWSNRTSTVRPPALLGTAMAFDTGAHRAILFGGQGRSLYEQNGQTWVYDALANVWQDENATTPPQGRQGHTMVFDPSSEETLLFGGAYQSGHLYPLNDLWAYHSANASWTQILPANVTSPPVGDGTTLIVAAIVLGAAGVLAVWLVWRRRTPARRTPKPPKPSGGNRT